MDMAIFSHHMKNYQYMSVLKKCYLHLLNYLLNILKMEKRNIHMAYIMCIFRLMLDGRSLYCCYNPPFILILLCLVSLSSHMQIGKSF